MYVLLFSEAKQKSAEIEQENEIALGHLRLLRAQHKQQLKNVVTFTAVVIIIVVSLVCFESQKSTTFPNTKQVSAWKKKFVKKIVEIQRLMTADNSFSLLLVTIILLLLAITLFIVLLLVVGNQQWQSDGNAAYIVISPFNYR